MSKPVKPDFTADFALVLLVFAGCAFPGIAFRATDANRSPRLAILTGLLDSSTFLYCIVAPGEHEQIRNSVNQRTRVIHLELTVLLQAAIMQRVPYHPFGLNNATSAAGLAPACLFETSEELHRVAVLRWRRRRRLIIALIASALVLAGTCVVIFVIV